MEKPAEFFASRLPATDWSDLTEGAEVTCMIGTDSVTGRLRYCEYPDGVRCWYICHNEPLRFGGAPRDGNIYGFTCSYVLARKPNRTDAQNTFSAVCKREGVKELCVGRPVCPYRKEENDEERTCREEG